MGGSASADDVLAYLLSGSTLPADGLTEAERGSVLVAASRAARHALRAAVVEREVGALTGRITPKVVEDAKRRGLWLDRANGEWWADMGDAHPYSLADHGPARAWLTAYFEEMDK